MKIAYVYDAVYPYITGGAEKRIYEVAKRLVADGHEVHWFGVKWWDGDDVIVQDGVYLHGVCKVGLYSEDGGRSIKEALYFGFKALKPLLKDFDIIDAGNFPYFPCFSAKFASLFKGVPLVITWHEVWGDYWYDYLGAKGFFGKNIEKITAKLPDWHIAVSEHTKRDLVALGVDDEKISVIPNGIDFKAIQKIPSSHAGCDVLFAGRLIKDKNVDVLLEAVAGVKNQLPDIRCCVIGDGPERDRLVALADDLGLKGNVEFLDFMGYDEYIALMKSSRLFVLPSSREGFGIVLLEAMASKTPVVAVRSEKSAASEIVDGENGVLCGIDELEENILEVLTNDKLRGGLIKNGLDYSGQFDWDDVAKSISKFYVQIVNG